MTLVRDAGESRVSAKRGWRQVVDGKGGGSWAHIAGRVLVVWMVTYLVLRADDATSGEAALVAVSVALTTLPFLRWATQAARAMPLAFGPVVVAAAAAALGFLAMAALSFLVPSLGLSRADVALIALTSFVLTAAWEVLVRRSASTPARVLVVGGGDAARRLAETTTRESTPFEIVAVVADDREEGFPETTEFYELSALGRAIEELSPELVVVAVERGRPEVFAKLLDAASEDFRMVGLPEFYEVAFGRLPVRELTPAWFMSTLHLYNRPYNRSAKRAFDIVVATLGLVITLPLVPFIVLVVKRTPGPLLYKQTRSGEHGRPFTILKFRSMAVAAEEPGKAQWADRDDPRIIAGGKLLRRTRLDELPQLWNVLRGDMTIVGPRPERPEFMALLSHEVPFWSQRLVAQPGITGWAQIRAPYSFDELGAEEKLSYDLWYLRHRSLALDTVICVKTVATLLTGAGAR